METLRWKHGDIDMETRKHGEMRHRDMEAWIWRHGDIERKTEAQSIFLNPFTVCSLCKQKFVVCQFVDEDTIGSYPFANGLNGLAHLCY
jgi:hypothetical protein